MPASALIVFLVVQRLVELIISRRNLEKAKQRGGREFFPETFKYVALLHTLFLVCLLFESGSLRIEPTVIKSLLTALFIALQAMRYWCIATLGMCWNARIVAIPGATACRRGPYRYLRHPNYLIVATEFLVIPLLLSAPWTLALFFPANLLVLRRRISLEEQVLAAETNYSEVFAR